jgi:hypothetical protein
MYALAYTLCFFLVGMALALLKIFRVIHLGWLWLLLVFAGTVSLGFGLLVTIFWLQERHHGLPQRENGNTTEPPSL